MEVIFWSSSVSIQMPIARQSRPVVAQARQLQRLDPPGAADLFVGLMIMAVTVQGGLAVGPSELVLHRPDATRGAVGGDLDFRHVPVMHRHDAFEHPAHERNYLVAALYYVLVETRTFLAHVHHGVGGEHLLPSGPLLGVHAAEIAGLELFDFFNCDKAFDISHREFSSWVTAMGAF